MSAYDVILVPCVFVKVPRIETASMAEAVERAEAQVDLHALFDVLDRTPPSGVATVGWTEEFSHYLVDELPPDGAEEPVESQFLNTAREPVLYDCTTGMWLSLEADGLLVDELGPFRRIAVEDGQLRCTPWLSSDRPQVFTVSTDGLHYHGVTYPHWAVESLAIPDHVGLPLQLIRRQPALDSESED